MQPPPTHVDVFALDDSRAILKAVEAVLAPLKVHSATLWSELSGAILASRDRPAVLVCDLEMPGMDGAEFCQILRRYCPLLKIVTFSSAVDRYDPAVLRSVSDRVISKSSGLIALATAVNQLRNQVLAPAS